MDDCECECNREDGRGFICNSGPPTVKHRLQHKGFPKESDAQSRQQHTCLSTQSEKDIIRICHKGLTLGAETDTTKVHKFRPQSAHIDGDVDQYAQLDILEGYLCWPSGMRI